MLHRLMLVALLVAVVACKKDDATSNQNPKQVESTKPEVKLENTETLDVGAAVPSDERYAGLKVKAPAGAKVEPSPLEVVIRVTEDMAYVISQEGSPGTAVSNAKSKAQSDELSKLVAFHVDTPEAALWETTSTIDPGAKNFHFAAEVKVGDMSFRCKNTGWGRFTRAQAEALLASCQSLTR